VPRAGGGGCCSAQPQAGVCAVGDEPEGEPRHGDAARRGGVALQAAPRGVRGARAQCSAPLPPAAFSRRLPVLVPRWGTREEGRRTYTWVGLTHTGVGLTHTWVGLTHLSRVNIHLGRVNTHLSRVSTHLGRVNIHPRTRRGRTDATFFMRAPSNAVFRGTHIPCSRRVREVRQLAPIHTRPLEPLRRGLTTRVEALFSFFY
jgi:hypothetical protein